MVFRADAFRGHESVSFFHDEESGLKAIIAIHSTALGPAAGGCRMWPYATEDAALEDALGKPVSGLYIHFPLRGEVQRVDVAPGAFRRWLAGVMPVAAARESTVLPMESPPPTPVPEPIEATPVPPPLPIEAFEAAEPLPPLVEAPAAPPPPDRQPERLPPRSKH